MVCLRGHSRLRGAFHFRSRKAIWICPVGAGVKAMTAVVGTINEPCWCGGGLVLCCVMAENASIRCLFMLRLLLSENRWKMNAR